MSSSNLIYSSIKFLNYSIHDNPFNLISSASGDAEGGVYDIDVWNLTIISYKLVIGLNIVILESRKKFLYKLEDSEETDAEIKSVWKKYSISIVLDF